MATIHETSAVLLAMSELLGREVALEDLLRALVDRIRLVLDADRGSIFLVDHGKREVFSKAAHLPELPEIRLPLGPGIVGHVAATGEVVNVDGAKGDSRFFRGIDEQTGYETSSILAAPIRDRAGTIVGVVQLLNKHGGHFGREDERLLETLGIQAGVVIEGTTLYAELLRSPHEALEPVPLSDRFNRIVGESEPMRRVYRLVTKAAVSEATVLLCGESGTGKELFARAVHVNSPRRDHPLVKVDCAALPTSLIENELFGHERGAFTSADQKSTGKFDQAQ
ncbi:MAG: sigma 54-interacting transcriptional regulator, partial [Deltaproteobacteria bacterium]|nr:sigma 54-interacting transcriptional regulator [Deltaproteobacteria bacterium]